MNIENKYSEELLEYIKDWAWDSWDCGQSLSCDDLDEFRKLLIEDDFKTIKNPVIQCPYCGSFKVRRTGKYDNLKTIMEQERTYKMIKGRIREKR